MKEMERIIAKVLVLKSEVKTAHGSDRQEFDKDNNPLWNLFIQENVWDEEFKVMKVDIKRYKSLLVLKEGEHIVELKKTSMGEGSGTFITIKNYYTILSKIDDKMTMEGFISGNLSTSTSLKKSKTNEKSLQ